MRGYLGRDAVCRIEHAWALLVASVGGLNRAEPDFDGPGHGGDQCSPNTSGGCHAPTGGNTSGRTDIRPDPTARQHLAADDGDANTRPDRHARTSTTGDRRAGRDTVCVRDVR